MSTHTPYPPTNAHEYQRTFPPATPVIDIARWVQKRTKGRGEEKQRIYVEKSQWRNKTVSTFSPLNVRAHRGRALHDRRSASGVRNNTRRGTYSYASLKHCSPLVSSDGARGKVQRSRTRRTGTESRNGLKSETMEIERGW